MYNLTKIINNNVIEIIKTRFLDDNFTGDIGNFSVSYLESQGSNHIEYDLRDFTRDEISSVQNARKQILFEKHKFFDLQDSEINNNSVNNTSNTTNREFQAQSNNEVKFLAQYNSQIENADYGRIAVGQDTNWCDHGIMTSKRVLYSTKDSMLCITAKYVAITSMKSGSFTESWMFYHKAKKTNNNDIYSHADWIEDEYINESAQPPLLREYLSGSGSVGVHHRIAFGDFDGNGREDEVILGYPGGFRVYKLFGWNNTGVGAQYSGEINYVRTSEYDSVANACKNVISVYHLRGYLPDIETNVVSIGDFNGDGKDDILCHTNSISNENGDLLHRVKVLLTNNVFSKSWTTVEAPSCDGQIRVADFNGDGKSDIMCLGVNIIKLFYSVDGTQFTSASGRFDGSLSMMNSDSTNKLHGWSPNYYNDSNNLDERILTMIGDFDNDGRGDLYRTALGIGNDNINKILFSDRDELFKSRTSDLTGSFSINNDQAWCSNGRFITVGDFNGDGKSDIWCNENGINKLVFSKISPLYAPSSPKITVKISNFQLQPILHDQCNFKTSVHTVVCDNRVRPDDKLTCKAEVGSSFKTIESISGVTAWQRLDVYGTLSVSVKNKFSVNIGGVEYQISTNQPDDQPAANLNNENQDFHKTSISIQVKSGECINMTMINKHASNVIIPYTAIGHLSAEFTGYFDPEQRKADLLSLAKQVVSEPVRIDPIDDSNVLFNIVGEIQANVVVDTFNYAENCDFV